MFAGPAQDGAVGTSENAEDVPENSHRIRMQRLYFNLY